MPGEAIDHLMAIVIMGALFVGAVIAVPTISYVNILYLEQQQLRNVALSVLKTILFDEGYPTNWGSMHGSSMFNQSDVKRFGLAVTSAPSLYVLDTDKVQKLASNPMGSIEYQKIKELLGLAGYDFSLIFRPQFQVDHNITEIIQNTGNWEVRFAVTVRRNNGEPVPNAKVSALLIYTTMGGGGGQEEKYDTKIINLEEKFTDSLGNCNGVSTITAPSGEKITSVAEIFKITVADRATLVVSRQDLPRWDDIAKISLVGDNIIATLNETAPGSKDSRWICDINMINLESSAVEPINLYDRPPGPWGEPDLQGGKRDLWTQTFPSLSGSDPALLIVTVRTEPIGAGGRTIAMMLGPYTMWSQGGIVELNTNLPKQAIVIVQRDVLIAGMAYQAELRLWNS
jgi:hypothetical protein